MVYGHHIVAKVSRPYHLINKWGRQHEQRLLTAPCLSLYKGQAIANMIVSYLYHTPFLQPRNKTLNVLYHLTTISTELGYLWEFVRLSLKPCSFYHEKLFIQVVNDISSQVFNNFFSASDIMEAVRGRFHVWYEGCVIQVRLLRSMYTQQKESSLQHTHMQGCRKGGSIWWG